MVGWWLWYVIERPCSMRYRVVNEVFAICVEFAACVLFVVCEEFVVCDVFAVCENFVIEESS